jgi:hypothetical protein
MRNADKECEFGKTVSGSTYLKNNEPPTKYMKFKLIDSNCNAV